MSINSAALVMAGSIEEVEEKSETVQCIPSDVTNILCASHRTKQNKKITST